MMSTSIDTVIEVRLRHEPGTLARLATAIAQQGGLLWPDPSRNQTPRGA